MAEQKVRVHDLSHDGRGVGRTESGKTCFVTGALPDEVVSWSLVKSKRSFDEGICTEILESSPDRVDPACEYFGQCGGCDLQHLDGKSQLGWKQKQLQALFAKSDVDVECWMPPLYASDWHYRRRTRLAVTYSRKGSAFVGFRARGSRQIVEITHCDVLDERLAKLIPGLSSLASSLKDAGLYEIELSAGDSQLAICFSLRSPLTNSQIDTVGNFLPEVAIWQKLPEREAIPVIEASRLRTKLPNGINMEFTPGQFVQINDVVNRAMIRQALDWLNPQADQHLLDLFCGAGNFSLAFGSRVASVLGVEGSQALCQQAERNARLNDLKNLKFQALDLFDSGLFSQIDLQEFELALIDPPRAGAFAIMPWLEKVAPQKILYISCHPATMVRDIQCLKGKYRVEKVGAMNMFPHTTHLEAMAFLVKR
jgi:23S rRNA (uracil1939-C5)-methyltransferase